MRISKLWVGLCGLSLCSMVLAEPLSATKATPTLSDAEQSNSAVVSTDTIPEIPVTPVIDSVPQNTAFAKMQRHAAVTPPEVVNVSSNNKYMVQLSSTDPNMITVHGDKIKDITCPTDACYVKNLESDSTGAAYISILNNTAFTAFVTTDHNRHFSLWITPLDEPGKTIVFNPIDGGNAVAGTFEKNTDYEELLINVTRDMQLGTMPDGYGVLDLHTMKPFSLPQGLLVQPVSALSGMAVAALHFKVMNPTENTIALSEPEFNHPGVRSITIQGDMNLPPHGTAELYEVVSNQNQSL